jgi:hypothetical protein
LKHVVIKISFRSKIALNGFTSVEGKESSRELPLEIDGISSKFISMMVRDLATPHLSPFQEMTY